MEDTPGNIYTKFEKPTPSLGIGDGNPNANAKPD